MANTSSMPGKELLFFNVFTAIGLTGGKAKETIKNASLADKLYHIIDEVSFAVFR